MAEEILKAYIDEYSTKPRTANELLQFAVGDQILMTKDRHAIIRYIGLIPEMGDSKNTYYGVELIDGTVGQNDGIIKGKRYFKTDGQRAMFIPVEKIRRVMTAKDHKRQESYSKLHSSVSALKDEYQGSRNSNASDTNDNINGDDNNNNDNDANKNNNDPTDVLSVVEVDVKNDNKENNEQSIIQSLEQAEEKQ